MLSNHLVSQNPDRAECDEDHTRLAAFLPARRQSYELTGDRASFLCFDFFCGAGSASSALSLDCALCWSTHAFAIPTASARTRAITPTRSVTEIAPRASRMLNRCEHFRQRS